MSVEQEVIVSNRFVFIRNYSMRKLYSTFYPITMEIQLAIVLIIIENKEN